MARRRFSFSTGAGATRHFSVCKVRRAHCEYHQQKSIKSGNAATYISADAHPLPKPTVRRVIKLKSGMVNSTAEPKSSVPSNIGSFIFARKMLIGIQYTNIDGHHEHTHKGKSTSKASSLKPRVMGFTLRARCPSVMPSLSMPSRRVSASR